MDLNEIKSLLNKISPWPWTNEIGDWETVIWASNKEQKIVYSCSVNNANFISQSPQIISDLIKEIENLKLRYAELEEQTGKTGAERLKLLDKVENLELRLSACRKEDDEIIGLERRFQAARNVAISYASSFYSEDWPDKEVVKETTIVIDKEIAEEVERLRKG